MKKTDYAYLAGIIDGEGCIRLQKAKSKGGSISYTPSVSVGMTVDYIPKLFHFAFGGSFSTRVYKDRPQWKHPHRWFATGEVAYACLTAIYPYLVIKKPQAHAAIQLYKSHTRYKQLRPLDKELQALSANRIKPLNQRGTGDKEDRDDRNN